MQAVVIRDGTEAAATSAEVAELVHGGEFFWLDLAGVDEEAATLLSDTFGFHRLAVTDAQHFGQRPKMNEFDDFTYFVVHGALPDGAGTSELHIFVTAHAVVTVHEQDCPALEDVKARIERRHASDVASPQVALLYVIVDSLVDTFFPELGRFDDQIDQLEDDILKKPTEQQLGVLFAMKRSLIGMRRVVMPQRDMFAALASGVEQLPGMTDEGSRYFRDLYDHLIRIADAVDSYRDLLSGVMDTHVSTVSNRLNVVMKQLTIIATIFLPLSFLTGFFGQNFRYLTDHIQGRLAFVSMGVGLEVLTVLGLLFYFRRKGWMGSDEGGSA
jgi:magnesium transporter